jgi:hypothetical protein
LPRGETFRISRLQKLASEQGVYLVGLAPNKISIRLLMIILVYLVPEICCPISSFQLPASGARPERNFQLPASGEHLRLAILGLGGISNFRLPASSFGPVDVKRREFPGLGSQVGADYDPSNQDLPGTSGRGMEASLSRRLSDAWYGGRGGPHAVRERRSLFGACKGSIFPVADRAFDELATGGCAASANVDAPKSLSWQENCRLVGFEVEIACPTCP